ncbi:hypothetical protein B6S12_07345 [Helicobacter valdiviensis]|uniref:Uncharacterized protein n=1 Tax=Helicobacter valdiviensis TaxID=1458358 RepID=A0A2W6NFK8_9HELI|nr:hypothetical protein [Helicobacter valdiviensis]PZT47740.1 hypothetical protein B6S12_07345 [Helicobacter valdiviensis]
MQNTYNKLMNDFLKERDSFTKSYQDTIKWLDEFYHNTKPDFIKHKSFKLETLIKNKKDLLETPKYTIELSKRLKELDNEIYYTARTLLQDFKRHKAKEIYQDIKTNKKANIGYDQDKDFLEKLCIKLDEKHSINSLYNLAKYFVKHWVLLFTLCNVIGALILMKYFALDIHYTPIITQENALFLLAMAGIIGIAYTIFVGLLLTLFIFYIKKIQENSKQYWSNKQILAFIMLINMPLLSTILVTLGDTFDIFSQWLLVIFCILLLIAFFIFAILFIKDYKDKSYSIIYILFLMACNLIFYFLFMLSLMGQNTTWIELALLTFLFFTYNAILILFPLQINFSFIKPSFIVTALITFLSIIPMAFSSNIISLLKLGNYDLSSLSLKPNSSSKYQKNCDFTLLKDEIILKNVHILSNRGEKILLTCKSNPVLAKKNDLVSEISDISSNAKNLTLNSNHTINIPSSCQTKNTIDKKVQLTNIRILKKRENDLVFECISQQFGVHSSSVNNSMY